MDNRDRRTFPTTMAARHTAPPAVAEGDMIYRQLGSTDERVSLAGLGGYHIGEPEESEAIRIIRTALDRGMNFLDNCWDYHKGASEERMGRALRDGYRRKAFLMTKIDAHNSRAAAAQIDQSLQRLQTDHVDLLQFHEVIRPGDPEKIFAAGGAAKAVLEAKQAGKIRYIGFTGHKDPDIHLKMLRVADSHGFRFDAVQMPLNVMDPHYKSFERKVLPVLVEKRIGVLAMKPFASGAILKTNTVNPVECLHYAMNLPVSVVITGCDSMEILEQALEAVRTFLPMDDSEIAALLARTAGAGSAGNYERFKTGTDFDGTVENPHWLERAEV